MRDVNKTNDKIINSLISGSLSSTFTTVLYQPLELLKTNIQLRQNTTTLNRVVGKSTKSARDLIRQNGIGILWRGTSASLLRSVPGVGIYYASLNLLQSNFSHNSQMPNDSSQAFLFALTSRSMVSFVLAPVTVIKVRYESGRYSYLNLRKAVQDAYFKSGWVGVVPTILRDSLFSGVYYMCYTQLKLSNQDTVIPSDMSSKDCNKLKHLKNFQFGIVSGMIASIVTNPLDVIKTLVQVESSSYQNSSIETFKHIFQKHGLARLFDGLGPRCLRRTLIAASTWTFYEFFMTTLK